MQTPIRTALIERAWQSNTTNIPWIQPYLPNAKAPASVVDTFAKLVGTNASAIGPLSEAVNKVMAGERLLHLTCTGEGEGGGLAILCGVFTSLAYPQETFVDVITFGTPWAGFDPQFAWFFDNMVNLFYLWPFSVGVKAADVQNFDFKNNTATLKAAKWMYEQLDRDMIKQAVLLPNLPPPLPPAPPGPPSMETDNVELSTGDYEQEVQDCYDSFKGISLTGDPYGVCAKGDPKIKSLGVLAPDPNLPSTPVSSCPPLVCKTREYLEKSSLAWMSDTVLDGLPYVSVDDETGANAIVAWNDTSKEIIILWKYTEETRDWLTDANVVLTENMRRVIEREHGKHIVGDLFDDPEVHSGFFNQFNALAIEGKGAKNLTEQIYNLTGGQEPTFVKISGFSLGGALTELAALWASYKWPKAHVLGITQGAPKVGTADYEIWFKANIGRVYRYIYNLDEVPAIPPFDSYIMTRRPLWIAKEDGSPYYVILTDRPPVKTSVSSWYCHWSEVFYVPITNQTQSITIPQWIHSQ